MNRTHSGTLYGIPVYFDFTTKEIPEIQVKYKWMEFILDMMEGGYGIIVWLRTWANPYYEPTFPLLVKEALSDKFEADLSDLGGR